jgi:hypothetical protein
MHRKYNKTEGIGMVEDAPSDSHVRNDFHEALCRLQMFACTRTPRPGRRRTACALLSSQNCFTPAALRMRSARQAGGNENAEL